jgi:hypothetical protein
VTAALLAVVLAAASCEAEVHAEGETDCAANLVVWEARGSFAGGAEWTGRQLQIRENEVLVEEATIRMGPAGLPPEEAPWFEVPSRAVPVAAFATSNSCRGECIAPACAELNRAGLSVLVRRATASDRCRPQVSVDLEGRKTSERVMDLRILVVRDGRAGLILTPRRRPRDLVCGSSGEGAGTQPEGLGWSKEIYDLGLGAVTLEHHPELPGPTAEEALAIQKAAADVLARAREISRRLGDTGRGVTSGLAAAPLAAALLREVGSVDNIDPNESELPPSATVVAAAVGPPDYVEALLATALRHPAQDWRTYDDLLRILGDRAVPAAAGALAMVFDDALDREDTPQSRISDVLRALLKADPAEARRQARKLLEEPRNVLPAVGVWFLTEPAVRRELAGVEPREADLDALAERVLRVIEEIESSTTTPSSSGTQSRHGSRKLAGLWTSANATWPGLSD